MLQRTSRLAGLIMTLTLAAGLAVQSHAYDSEAISTIEATLYNSSGQEIATGGSWDWSGGLWIFDNLPVGTDNTLEVLARDSSGSAIYGGSLSGVEILPDIFFPSSFDFGLPPATGSLILMMTPDGIYVLAPPFTEVGILILLPLKVDVALDIKPGSDTNPYNVKAKGKLPAVVAGSADVPANAIDPDSLNILGVAPVKITLEDIVTWSEDDLGKPISTDGADGIADLVLHFDRQALTEAMGSVTGGEVVSLVLDGTLISGTSIEGLDAVTITPKVKRKGKK